MDLLKKMKMEEIWLQMNPLKPQNRMKRRIKEKKVCLNLMILIKL